MPPDSPVNSGSSEDSGEISGGGGGGTTSGPVVNDPATWEVEGDTLSVPSGATVTADAIQEAQSANDNAITTIEFKNGVTIGDNAFQGSSISSVTGWENVISIGDNAFKKTNITGTPDLSRATTIGASAFEGTNISGELNLSSATSIGQGAFKGTGITSVTFAAGVNIEMGTMTIVGDEPVFTGAFAECDNLTSVTFDGSADVGAYAFFDCSLTSVTFNGSADIGENAFYDCSLTTVTFGGPTTVGVSAFLGCTSLTSVDGWENVTSIGNSAFSVTGLTSVKLGADLTKLEANAFNRCTSLTSVDLSACTRLTNETTETNCTIGNYAFQILDYEAPNKEPVNLALKLPDNASGWTVGTDAFRNRNVTLYYKDGKADYLNGSTSELKEFLNTGATTIAVAPAANFPDGSSGGTPEGTSLMSGFSAFRDLLS